MKLPCNKCLEKMGKKAAEMIGNRQRCCSETLEEVGELCGVKIFFLATVLLTEAKKKSISELPKRAVVTVTYRNGFWYRAGGVVGPIKEGWCVLICHGAVKTALAAQVVATTAVSVV